MSWWKCAACGSRSAAAVNGSTTASAASPSAVGIAPHLLLKQIPSSAMAPLFFYCAACSLRMASCESCHVLVDAGKVGGGVLLCRRCGVLSVLDPTLRALLAIPAFNRSFLNRVSFAIADIVELRERIVQCEAQLKSAKQQHLRDSESAESGSTLPSQQGSSSDSMLQRKRKRVGEAASADSQVSPPPSFRLVDTFPSQQSASSPQQRSQGLSVAALETELKALQRQLHELVRQWEQFASETTAEQSTPLRHHLQQSFSSTHLNILRVMYDNTTGKLEVAALTRQIEQFLLHQSTLLKMKYDLLAAVATCQEIEQLRASVFQTNETPSKVTNLIINLTKEQLNHRYRAFQALSRPYLSLVGAANKHLFALYSAAQSLQSMRETSEHEREAAIIQRELFGSNSGSKERADHTRSRRRYGYGTKSSSSSSSSSNGIMHTALGDHHHHHHHLIAGGYDDVSRVQQTLEFGNRITEISKKVELWRALSSTIATTCVLSVLELANANDAPLS